MTDDEYVPVAVSRRIGWEPESGNGHRDPGGRWGHRWSYELTPDGPDATVVTETYDCSRAPADECAGMRDGKVWLEAMAETLERLDALCASAAQTLVLFLTPLIVSAVLLVPGQPDWVVGVELIVAALGASGTLLGTGRLKRGLPDDDKRLIRIFDHRSTNVVVMLLFVASGIFLASGSDAGLYLLLPASLVAFVSGVLNAWYFLLPPQSAPKRKAGRGPYRGTGRRPNRRDVIREFPPSRPP